MKFLDRAIATVAPRIALRREAAKKRLSRHAGHLPGGMSSGYEGAARGRRTDNWMTRRGDANAALRGALQILRARSRDLCRNNPWAVSGIGNIEEWTIGEGIELQAAGDSAIAAEANELWRTWSHASTCDAEGIDDLGGLQALVMRTVVESGSALIRRRRRTGTDADGLPLPLQIQVLEPDHLDLDRITGDNGRRVTHGVEIDGIGRRVAYWLYPDHPGSDHPTAKRTESRRVPASEIAHVYLRKRAGQVQDAPWLTPVILRTRTLDEFEDAELLRMVIASSWSAFISQERDPDGPEEDLLPIEDLQAGAVEYLRPGESVTFPTLPDVKGREGYVGNQLLGMAAGLRVPYIALTGDLTKVNYSSGRIGLNGFERRCGTWRKRMIVGQMLRPIWGWFIEEALANVALPVGAQALATTFTPPPRMILDPAKESQADFAEVRNGTKTLSEVLRSRGKDPRKHLEELAADFELLDELGLTLDLDPRRVAVAGAATMEQDDEEEDTSDDEPEDEEESDDDETEEESNDDEAA